MLSGMIRQWIEDWLAERRERRIVLAEIAAGRPLGRILLDSGERFMARCPGHPANQAILAQAEIHARILAGERTHDA